MSILKHTEKSLQYKQRSKNDQWLMKSSEVKLEQIQHWDSSLRFDAGLDRYYNVSGLIQSLVQSLE